MKIKKENIIFLTAYLKKNIYIYSLCIKQRQNVCQWGEINKLKLEVEQVCFSYPNDKYFFLF